MGAQGTTTVDFGAFPGASDTSVVITGQTGILAGSLVEAWIFPTATADHSADEHMYDTLEVRAGNVVAGTGFTIYAYCENTLYEPVSQPVGANSIYMATATTVGQKIAQPGAVASGGGRGPRLYGLYTVGWVWN
jgi:hypothetical protein